MKKLISGISLTALLLSSNPVLANDNVGSKYDVIKQTFDALSPHTIQFQTSNEVIRNVTEARTALGKAGVTMEDIRDYISQGKSGYEKAQLDSAFESYSDIDVSKLTHLEMKDLMSDMGKKFDTGANYKNCGINTYDTLRIIALTTGVVGGLTAMVAHNKSNGAEESIENLNVLITQNNGDIQALINEGVREDSFLITAIKTENELLALDIQAEQADIEDADTMMNYGFALLAVAGVSGAGALYCDM